MRHRQTGAAQGWKGKLVGKHQNADEHLSLDTANISVSFRMSFRSVLIRRRKTLFMNSSVAVVSKYLPRISTRGASTFSPKTKARQWLQLLFMLLLLRLESERGLCDCFSHSGVTFLHNPRARAAQCRFAHRCRTFVHPRFIMTSNG